MYGHSKKIKIIISGGGTGGHVYPAIAIADALKAQNPVIDILFVGARGKIEMEKIPHAGYRIEGLNISGLQRKLSLNNLLLPFKLLQSLWRAHQIIQEFRPDVVVGVGGYASAPVLKISAVQKIPTVIQEQNSYAGLTNKLLAKSAAKIFVAYPNMEYFFSKEKIIFSGNPIRQNIERTNSCRKNALIHFGLCHKKQTLLIIGGSLGALTINESIRQGVKKLQTLDYQIIWQTGKYYYEHIRASFESRNTTNIFASSFIERMDYAYACADVVISRAGALSVSELCVAGKASIFVPSPNVAEDHQRKNAQSLVKENAALLVEDSQAQKELVDSAIELLRNKKQQLLLQKNILKFSKPKAAQVIAEEILSLAK